MGRSLADVQGFVERLVIETAERSYFDGKLISGVNRPAIRMLSPAAAFYAANFAVPMLCLFILSFWRAEGFAMIPDFTFSNYAKIADSTLYRALILRTIGLGLIVALIAMPLAFVLSYLMRFTFEWRARLVLQLILLSMFSGYLVRIYAWRTILGKQGLLNAMLQWLGLTDQPLAFLIYSNFAVVVTLTALLLPLAVLPIYSAMCNVSRDHLEAARDLGSSGGHLVRTILLPMVLPGVRAAFAFAFFLAAGDFVTPALVGGAQSLMIGNVVADQFRGVGSNWPLGAALAFVTIAAVLAIYFAGIGLLRRFTAW
jgi:spermidine/putrescine transport system permease protein